MEAQLRDLESKILTHVAEMQGSRQGGRGQSRADAAEGRRDWGD